MARRRTAGSATSDAGLIHGRGQLSVISGLLAESARCFIRFILLTTDYGQLDNPEATFSNNPS